MKIYSLIQARGGSKGVPKKNIKLLGGYPLIAYSIVASRLCKKIQRTIVSTDSPEIAKVAKRYGAEIPFLRPAKFAQDLSTDLDVISHAIRWFEIKEKKIPDILVQLRPTAPLRDPILMNKAIKVIQTNPGATALRSVQKISHPPQKMLQVKTTGFLDGFFSNDLRPEYYNLPRQLFQDAYRANNHIDIVRPDFVKNNPGWLYGSNVLPFFTPPVVDIDFPEDFEYLEFILQRYPNPILNYLSKNFPKEKTFN